MSTLSFGVIADCQYGDKDDEDVVVAGTTDDIYYNRPRLSPGKLREAVDTLNQHDLKFVVHLGDFTDKDLDGYEMLTEITDTLKAPLWHVLGNHDYEGLEGNEAKVLQTYGLKSPYYSHVIDGYRLIVLDTNELGVMKHLPGTEEWQEGRILIDKMKAEGAINAYDWNGGVGPDQFEWLTNELNTAKANSEKVVLFAHHPLFPPYVLNALNSEELLDLFAQYDNIVAFINGHNHQGAYGVKDNIPYITIAGMVQTETNAFGVVTLNDGDVNIKGYGRVQDISHG
jgi:manganese-dependent ADP-ribose/CDP-alcohol diphosphatase